jgi:hypothetical protein
MLGALIHPLPFFGPILNAFLNGTVSVVGGATTVVTFLLHVVVA